MSASLQKVDYSALRTNQVFIIGLNILAFVLDNIWLALFVGLVMSLGTLVKRPGFGIVYARLLKPLGLVKPNVIQDNPEPHRFALGFGAVVMLAAVAVHFSGLVVLGWGLIWLVVALAALNLFAGFCVGCAVYYWLNQFGLPGFTKSPPDDTFPGMRPKVRV